MPGHPWTDRGTRKSMTLSYSSWPALCGPSTSLIHYGLDAPQPFTIPLRRIRLNFLNYRNRMFIVWAAAGLVDIELS